MNQLPACALTTSAPPEPERRCTAGMYSGSRRRSAAAQIRQSRRAAGAAALSHLQGHAALGPPRMSLRAWACVCAADEDERACVKVTDGARGLGRGSPSRSTRCSSACAVAPGAADPPVICAVTEGHDRGPCQRAITEGHDRGPSLRDMTEGHD